MGRLWPFVLIAMFGAAPASNAVADDHGRATRSELGCEITDYGIYVPESKRVRFADRGSVTGDRFEIQQVRFVRRTKTIEPTLGQRFGIRYRITQVTSPSVNITLRVTYPSPVRGATGWQHSFVDAPSGDELTGTALYDFVIASELVEGRWRFDVLVDGRQACTFGFLIQQPRMAAGTSHGESTT